MFIISPESQVYPPFGGHLSTQNVSLTTKRVDKLMFTLMTMIRAFTT